MLNRFAKIRREAGTYAFVSQLLMIAAMVYFSLSGLFHYSSPIPLVISILGLLIGFLLRDQFSSIASSLRRVTTITLVVYGIAYVSMLRLGLGNLSLISLITFACMMMFTLNFWTLSHPNVHPIE